MPTTDTPGRAWHLADADELHRANPATFQKPSDDEIAALVRAGSVVKLIFKPNTPDPAAEGERMWVEVAEVLSDGRFKGALVNDPVVIEGLKWHDPVDFDKRHIINIYTKG